MWSKTPIRMALFRRLAVDHRPRRGAQTILVGDLPILRLLDALAATDSLEQLWLIDNRRHGALIAQGARIQKQPTPRAGDHLVARRQMFPRVIDDLAHAFGDRLILHRDMRD